MELMQVNRQWRDRPQDERFLSLTEMLGMMESISARSLEKTLGRDKLTFMEAQEDEQGLQVAGPNGGKVALTNWSFGQLAGLAGAPAGYMRELPPKLAAQCLNHGVRTGAREDTQILLTKTDAGAVLRAANGPRYGRVYNSDVVRTLIHRVGDGRTGTWKVPGEFGKEVEITRENTTLYAGDRDMFVFLADEEHRIEVPSRRHGKTGSLARGFFVWNSEVGARTLGIATFLFDFVCSNRIVWGAQAFRQIKIRHSSGAPDRWADEVYPALVDMSQQGTGAEVRQITAAQRARVETGKLDELLVKSFGTASRAGAIKAAHLADEGRPMETLWDVVVGATAYARGLKWQDERVAVETQAGKVLDLVF